MQTWHDSPFEIKKRIIEVFSTGNTVGIFSYIFFWLFLNYWFNSSAHTSNLFLMHSLVFVTEALALYLILNYKQSRTEEAAYQKIRALMTLSIVAGLHWGVLLPYLLYSSPLPADAELTIFILITGYATLGGAVFAWVYQFGFLYSSIISLPLIICAYYFDDPRAGLLTVLAICLHLVMYVVTKRISEEYHQGSQLYKDEILLAKTWEKIGKTDHTTKLDNRYSFLLEFQRCWYECMKSQQPFNLLYIQIKELSEIKKTYGEHYSEQCLAALSKRLIAHVKEPNKISRYSSDSLMVTMPEASISKSTSMAESLNKVIEDFEYTNKNTTIKLSSTIGIQTNIPSEKDTPDQALSAVENAISDINIQHSKHFFI